MTRRKRAEYTQEAPQVNAAKGLICGLIGDFPGRRPVSRSTRPAGTWRRSAGTVLYVGAGTLRNGDPTAQRGSEAFIKLQFDVDEACDVVSLRQAPTTAPAQGSFRNRRLPRCSASTVHEVRRWNGATLVLLAASSRFPPDRP